MKKFLSIEKFKEIRVLLILEIIMSLLLMLLIKINNINVIYFDYRPLLLTISVWTISSIIEKEKYFNLATLIGTGLIMYISFWLMFNINIQ